MKNTRTLLQDMLQAIETIEVYAVVSYEAFLEDGKTQDAVMFNLIIMGEAANQMSRNFRISIRKFPGHLS